MLPYFGGNVIAKFLFPTFYENFYKEGLINEQLNIELINETDESYLKF